MAMSTRDRYIGSMSMNVINDRELDKSEPQAAMNQTKTLLRRNNVCTTTTTTTAAATTTNTTTNTTNTATGTNDSARDP